jgi:asparagine synthase (glutamine-hydrolysing)
MTPDPHTPYGRVAALEASLYMRNQLLRDADWAGMAHSLEIRVPLVDAQLLRTLAPALVARPGMDGKRLLAACPGLPLPQRLVDRPKTGFGTPIERWIQTGRARVADQRWHWARHWACNVLTPSAA